MDSKLTIGRSIPARVPAPNCGAHAAGCACLWPRKWRTSSCTSYPLWASAPSSNSSSSHRMVTRASPPASPPSIAVPTRCGRRSARDAPARRTTSPRARRCRCSRRRRLGRRQGRTRVQTARPSSNASSRGARSSPAALPDARRAHRWSRPTSTWCSRCAASTPTSTSAGSSATSPASGRAAPNPR